MIFFLHDCNDLLFNEFLAINDINTLGKSGKRIANLLATEVVDCGRSNRCWRKRCSVHLMDGRNYAIAVDETDADIALGM